MSDDVLAVWMDGYATAAGYLARAEGGETAFFYEERYVDAGGLPLSLSLPLEQQEFGDVQTRAFFANLLPENAQLQRLMERQGLNRDDVVGLLRHLGADCAGAISCLPIDAPPVKVPGLLDEDYEPLDDRAVEHIVRSLYEARRVPDEVTDPSPVAGVQSKIALTVLPGRRFALPRSGSRVPTTHILKVPSRGQGRDARFEESAALLAAAAGLDVSVPEAIKIGDIDALLIERFDRQVADGRVTRIHQEDFAQALGLPSELKYQRNGRPGRWFDVMAILSVLNQTVDPPAARLAFIQSTIFNLCIGNTDNHAKNHALLYDQGRIPRFAPLYDLLPIRLSKRYTHELAFQIGPAKHFDDMIADNLRAFFSAFGFEGEVLPTLIEQVVAPVIDAVERATPKLRSGAGMKPFDDLIGREVEQLVELLSLSLSIRERDYFPPDGTN